MVELALGMFALALVLSAIFGFSAYIVSSLEMQRELRVKAGRAALNSFGSYSSAADSDTVRIEPFAADYIFGTEELKVREEVHIPAMGGLDL